MGFQIEQHDAVPWILFSREEQLRVAGQELRPKLEARVRRDSRLSAGRQVETPDVEITALGRGVVERTAIMRVHGIQIDRGRRDQDSLCSALQVVLDDARIRAIVSYESEATAVRRPGGACVHRRTA